MEMVNGKPQPCKDCEKRHFACHDDCSDYAEFRKWCDMVNKKRFASNETNRVFWESFNSGIRGRKNRGRRK